MGEPLLDEQSTGTIATGGEGTVLVTLAKGTRLTHASATSTNTRAPLHCAIRVTHSGFNHHLVSGWVYGLSVLPVAGSISWDGEILFAQNTRLVLVVRNNTGSDGAVTLMWAAEKP